MTPKKAIIIILILMLLIIASFVFLFYINKNKPENILPAKEEKTLNDPQSIIKEKIQEILINGEKEGKTKDEIREDVLSAVNNYIREYKKNQTPEEKALEEAKNIERKRIVDEFNNSIKNN